MANPWYGLVDQDKYLYHYTRAQTLVDHILPSNCLRFSRFENVNDPQESKDWTFNYLNVGDADCDLDGISGALNALLKKSWRIAANSRRTVAPI